MKTCKICKTQKSFAEFYKNVSTEDGYRAWCKVCQKSEAARKKTEDDGSKKLCLGCGLVLEKSLFSPRPQSPDGLRSRCKDCTAKEVAAWREQNPEKCEETQKKHAKNRRERYNKDEEYRKKVREKNHKNWHALPPEEKYRRGRANALKTNYDITVEQYDQMVKDQESKCACCGNLKEEGSLVVDHDHDTKEIRGLLCYSCNSGLGFLGDCVEGLMKALEYLRKKR